MGFFSWLFSQPNPPELPKVNTILPDAAKQEIENGRLARTLYNFTDHLKDDTTADKELL